MFSVYQLFSGSDIVIGRVFMCVCVCVCASVCPDNNFCLFDLDTYGSWLTLTLHRSRS